MHGMWDDSFVVQLQLSFVLRDLEGLRVLSDKSILERGNVITFIDNV